MTQCNKDTNICLKELVGGKVCRPCFETQNKKVAKVEIMIKGYQEMADINLNISKHCFGVESEADEFYNQLTECD